MSGSPPEAAKEGSVPIVGETEERSMLREALLLAQRGQGGVWLLEGPGGIGKTRLARWLEHEARREGFRVASASCLREAMTPFFPFLQIFRELGSGDEAAEASTAPDLEALPSLTIFEEERPREVFALAARLAARHPVLVASRDPPASVRKAQPALPPGVRILWLSRSEGADSVHPQNVDHLGEVFAQHLAARPGSTVLLAGLDYLASQAGSLPLLRLVQFLRDAAEETGGHVLLSMRPQAMEPRDLARVEAEGEVVRPSPAPTASPRAPEASEAPGATLMRYLDTLEEHARRGPVLVLVEDLQWADPESVRAVQFLGRGLRDLRVLLVPTLRTGDPTDPTEESRAEQGLDGTLESMDQEGVLHRLRLRPLAHADALELLSRFLGGKIVRSGPAEALLERAKGNPYFLLSMTRLLSEEGRIRPQAEGLLIDLPPGEDAAVPRNLKQSVVRRLSHLSPDQLNVLRAAALLGLEFDVPPLASVLGIEGSEVTEVLRRLHDLHRIVDAAPGSKTRWAFVHPVMREVVAGELSSEQTARYSRALGDWWETHHPEDVEGIARLRRQAGDPAQAVPWVRRALDHAIDARHAEIAERYIRWLVELRQAEQVDGVAILREVLPIVDRLRAVSGPSQSVGRLIELLRPLVTAGPWHWEVEGRHALHSSSSTTVSLEILQGIERETVGQEVPTSVVALLALARSNRWFYDGRWEEAVKEAHRAAELFTGLGEYPRVASALYYETLGNVQLHRMEEAEAGLARLEELRRETGLPMLTVVIPMARADMVQEVGDVRGSIAVGRELVQLQRARGDFWNAASAYVSLGEALLEFGDLAGAAECTEETVRIGQRFGGDREVAICHLTRGMLAFVRGHQEEAEREIAAGMNLSATERLAAEVRLQEVRSVGGDPTEVLREVEELGKKAATMPARDRVQIALVRARLLVRLERLDEAEAELERARGAAGPHRLQAGRVAARRALLAERRGDRAKAARLRAEAEEHLEETGIRPEARAWILSGEDPTRALHPAAVAERAAEPPPPPRASTDTVGSAHPRAT